MKKYIVTQEFVDKYDFSKRYEAGTELPDSFDDDRLTSIVIMGLAKVVDEQSDAPKKQKKSDSPKEPLNE